METLKSDPGNASIVSGCDEESIELHGDVMPKTGVGGMSTVERDNPLEAKHKVFLSHSGVQKDFVEQLCVDLERCDIYPFFDKRQSSLPIGEEFPNLIFEAIGQCEVGVLVFLEEFFCKTKWPMLELVEMVRQLKKPNGSIRIIAVLFFMSWEEWLDEGNCSSWISKWEEWGMKTRK